MTAQRSVDARAGLILETDPGALFGESSALFDTDQIYRYQLTRAWKSTEPTAVWVMLNPSTANAFEDDPTIRRVRGFSEREGYGAFTVVNLFALRSPDPRLLHRHPDPVGPCNDWVLRGTLAAAAGIIVAWGAHPLAATRAPALAEMLAKLGREAHCLGTAQRGAPLHPLYLSAASELVPWTPPSVSAR